MAKKKKDDEMIDEGVHPTPPLKPANRGVPVGDDTAAEPDAPPGNGSDE